MTADKIDEMERQISADVYLKHGVILTGIGIYSLNTKDDETQELRTKIFNIIAKHDEVLQIHGFHYNKEQKAVAVDVIFDFATDMQAAYDKIKEELCAAFPDVKFTVIMDLDA